MDPRISVKFKHMKSKENYEVPTMKAHCNPINKKKLLRIARVKMTHYILSNK